MGHTHTLSHSESLPAQVPAVSQPVTHSTCSKADELIGLVEFRARNDAPPSMQSHVDALAAEHTAKRSGDEARPRSPINDHLSLAPARRVQLWWATASGPLAPTVEFDVRLFKRRTRARQPVMGSPLNKLSAG